MSALTTRYAFSTNPRKNAHRKLSVMLIDFHGETTTDVGMCEFHDRIIGVKRTPILRNFLTKLPVRHELPTPGEAVMNAPVIGVDSGSKAKAITHFIKYVTI